MMSWKEAITSVLKESGRRMSVAELTQQILDKELRPRTPTPERTCSTEAGNLVRNAIPEPGFGRMIVERYGDDNYYEYEYVGLACDFDDDLRIRYDECMVEFLLRFGDNWRAARLSSIKIEYLEQFLHCLEEYRSAKSKSQ